MLRLSTMDWNFLAQILIVVCGSGGVLSVIVVALKEIALARINKKTEMSKTIKKMTFQVNASEEKLDTLSDGMLLLLKSNKIIFQAFRDKHINGESEEMDKHIDEYLMRLLSEHLKEDCV